MPAFIEKGKGCYVWDLDGNKYIDYRCSLGPIILGHRYPEVEKAVKAQMQKGVLFSMASPLELKLAETIRDVVPGAEMVRFLKTGCDANLALVRIARAYTRREKMIITGYHGWHDYVMPQSGIEKGVPQAISRLVYQCKHGDIDAIERIVRKDGNNIACILTEPYNWERDTTANWVKALRKITTKYGILLIFDEVLTGFRLALGGAQEYFGVVPDLASFAKAVSNGYPLSIFSGKKRYMQVMDKIVVTTTYAGETLSIAAGLANLGVMRREKVHQHIWKMGNRLMQGLESIANDLGIETESIGLAPASQFIFKEKDEKLRGKMELTFGKELFQQGIFYNSLWFISYSHKEGHIDRTLDLAKKALKKAKR